jgi:hypothetical protein
MEVVRGCRPKKVLGEYGCPALSLGWSPLCSMTSVSLCMRLTSSQGSIIVGLVSAMVQIMADWLQMQPARKGIATLWFIHIMRVRDSVRESKHV